MDLYTAVKNGSINTIVTILTSSPPPTVNDMQLAFDGACDDLNHMIMSLLLHYGAVCSDYDNRALRMASSKGDVEIVRLLLDNGADPSAYGGQALETASKNGDHEIVRLLLEHGADPSADGGQALETASKNGHLEVVRLLLQFGASPKTNNSIKLATASGNSDIVRLLTIYLKPASSSAFF